jgi:hypothetical protein
MPIELQPRLRIELPSGEPVGVADIAHLARIDAPGAAVGIGVAIENTEAAVRMVDPFPISVPVSVRESVRVYFAC